MLTDLSFIDIGQVWPPPSEVERLQTYANNKLLFEGDHPLVYTNQFKRIARVKNNFEEVVSFEIVANFHQLISKKTADLLFGEPPNIIAGEKDTKEQVTVENIEETSDLNNTCYMAALDVSRYGDGLFYIRKDEAGGVIDVTQPSLWFKVVDPRNTRKTLYHVLAWTYMVGKAKYLYCQIHEKGRYEEKTCLLRESMIYSLIENKVVQTGLNDFAIIQIPNMLTSDRIYGLDDYKDIDSIISEVEVRLSQISKILDEHSRPSMQGPSSALSYDDRTGEYKVKAGNYFIIEDENGKVEYLTWDAQLDANFKDLEVLTNLLYTISEMGSAIFGDMSKNSGQVPSGSALRRLMISPLAKVNRIRMRFDGALKKAIKLCSQLGGNDVISLADKPVTIQWQDGLPGDPKEEAEIMASRTNNKATMSVKRALKTYDGMSDEDAENEIVAIDEDETKTNPFVTPPLSNNPDGEE